MILACAVTAAVLFVADAVLATTFRGFLLGQLDQQLQVAADRVVDAPRGPGPFGQSGEQAPTEGPPPLADDAGFSEFFLARADGEGRLVQRVGAPLSDPEDRVPQTTPAGVVNAAAATGRRAEPFEAVSDDGTSWRLVAVRADDGAIVVAGQSMTRIDATYRRVLLVLAIATVAVLVTLTVVFWWVLRHGVRPLAAMTATAGAIADGQLSHRVAETDPRTEAGRLGRALNTMLTRIEVAFSERAASEGRLRRFVADASHELRTPLTSVRGYAELYEAGGLPPGPDLDDTMRRVKQEAARMGDLVEDLLLLARLDEGRMVERRLVRLDALAVDAVRDARAVEPDRPIYCDVEPAGVHGDEAGLRQAIGNLLANVRAHTPGDARVDVIVRVDGDHTDLVVADAGPGMPAEVADRVFERFFRADPSRARGASRGGAGLGLAIVAGIVAAHGGTADVASTPHEGTTFTLRLPVRSPPSSST